MFKVAERIPSFDWLRKYPRQWFSQDLIAGLTTAAVVIPKAMAYAAIAGLPVEIGLYTALVPMVIYAVLGTSRVLSVSTTTTIAILTAAEIGELAQGGSRFDMIAVSAALAILVGLYLTIASFLRLGFLANFISEPVLVGFKCGIGLVIILDQVPKLLGIHITKVGFFRDILSIIEHAPGTSVPTVTLAVSLFVLVIACIRFLPRVPAPLVAIAVAVGASALLHLESSGVATVGNIPMGLPGFKWPDTDIFSHVAVAAAGIALMSFTETIAAARAFSDPSEPPPAPNQELLAIGFGNIVGGLFTAMPSGGGTSQTAVNRNAGAKTQVAQLVTAGATVVTLLILAPVISLMPFSALAVLVVVYSLDLIHLAEFREILRVRRVEFYWAVVALIGVMFFGTLRGILVAVLASLAALMYQVCDPAVYVLRRKPGTDVFRPESDEHPNDEFWPGLLIVQVQGRVFFANAKVIGDKIWPLVRVAKPKVVVFDFSGVFDIEYTALKMLIGAEKKLRQQGVGLWLVALNPEVRKMVLNSELGPILGRDRMLFNVQVAVEKFVNQERLGESNEKVRV